MPRYFFHVINGKTVLDLDGTELPNLTTARLEAVKVASDILSTESAASLRDGKPWEMNVADAHGRTILTLRFSADDHSILSDEIERPAANVLKLVR